MPVFGRKAARQRMRRATQQALSVPTFRTSMDCTPWVLGGLWPTELQRVTSDTTLMAEYLKKDLQRIADSANERLRAIAEAGLDEPVRQAEESRVINVGRAFAVLRVESTVRQLRKEPLGFAPELLGLTGPSRLSTEPVVEDREPEPLGRTGRHRGDDDNRDEPVDGDSAAVGEPADVEVIEPLESVEPALALAPEPEPRIAETDEIRLRRLVRFVARQEPGLRWAVGCREDGVTVLATDLAHGWIPPGVKLPAGVELLSPERRSGNAAALLATTAPPATYAPGNSFGGLRDRVSTAASVEPRRLDEIDGLEHKLADATRQREGLPRLTYALVSTAVAGDTAVEAEVDVLRVHLDTARYQLLAQYPDIDNGLLLNCLLLAATEALVTGDQLAANYHFGWFRALRGPTGPHMHMPNSPAR